VLKTDAGKELRVSCKSLFDARHPNQNHANVTGIEDCSNLSEACHAQAVGLYSIAPWLGVARLGVA